MRRGHVITVLDGDTAVAQIVPCQPTDTLRVQRPLGLHRALHQVPLPPPLPTPLGTLDAIHLATALLWRETRDPDLLVATHDRALALAARGSGFRVIGI